MLREYYKVMVVRDPLERLLSAYKDKFIPENIKHIWIDRLSKAATGRRGGKSNDFTFLQFLRLILQLKPGKFEGHWDRYHDYCTPCSIDYSFIGNTDKLSKEIPYILDKIGVKANDLPRKVPWENKAKYPRKKTSYFADIPMDVIKGVWNLYKEDYEMFGYNFTVPNL